MSYLVGGYLYTKKVLCTANKSYAPSNVGGHFSVIDLSKLSDAELWDHTNAAGAGIIAADENLTRIPMYLDNFNFSAKTGQLYVAFDFDSADDTEISIMVGNLSVSQPSAAAAYGREATCPSRQVASHRFSEDPSASAPQGTDHTSHDNNITTTQSMSSGDLVDAIQGKGWELDGVLEGLSMPTNDFDNTKGSISILFKIPFGVPWSAYEVPFWIGPLGNQLDVLGCTYDPVLDKVRVFGGGAFKDSFLWTWIADDIQMLTVTYDSVSGEKWGYLNDGTTNLYQAIYSAKTMPSIMYLFDFNGDGTFSFPGTIIDVVMSDEVETAAAVYAKWYNFTEHDNFWTFTAQTSPFVGVKSQLID